MKEFDLPSLHPAWHHDPATPGQIKVLRFFGEEPTSALTKGVCAGFIGRLFSDDSNRHLWAAYVYSTGDNDRLSAELKPHNKAELACIEIPDDWWPKREGITAKERAGMVGMISEELRDGSPFDDPLPEIRISGTAFCFTGKFEFGSRKECMAAVVTRGGIMIENITLKTDVLVIGNDPNPRWAHGTHGNKIMDAMVLRLKRKQPVIIPELHWRDLLEKQPVAIA